MKKYIILCFSMLFSFGLFAQHISNHVVLQWDKMNIDSLSLVNAKLHQLQFEDGRQMGKSGLLPYYYIELKLPANTSIENAKISNVTAQSFVLDSTDYENSYVDLNLAYKISTYINYDDNQEKTIMYFPTLKNNAIPYVIDQLISFDLIYDLKDRPASLQTALATPFSEESVMKSGEWHRFEINKSGVFKMTYDYLISVGISFDDWSSSQIKMFGFGGMIAENNSDFHYADIPETAIEMYDGGDGVFNSGDYFLFYAQGPDTWKYNELSDVFYHQLNVYSRASYYYLALSQGDGLRITEEANMPDPNFTVNSFIDYDVIEDENENLRNMGRRWFGDKYEFTTQYKYEFNFKHLKSNAPIWIKTLVVARSEISSRFKLDVLDQNKTIVVSKLPSGAYAAYAVNGEVEWHFNNSSSSDKIAISLDYNQPLSGSTGWLDYIEINVERELKYDGGQMAFRSPESVKEARISKFEIQNLSSSEMKVWEVSSLVSPQKISLNGSGNIKDFSLATPELKEFIAFNPNDLPRPSYVEAVENQNLHAEINHDYIIITHPNFLSQAEELAQFHRDNSGLDVFVTTLQPIYNEFSSGRQDIGGIRDFVKSVYDNSASNKRLKYLLLFGDASIDYLGRLPNNENFVPTWESYNSLDPINSIASDDFFGCLSPGEGSNLLKNTVDIGIGRFVVVNTTQAQEMVDKVTHYKGFDDKVMADWRNTICFISDDEDNNTHIKQANGLSKLVDSIYPTANLDKIFVDAYQQESTPAGQRYPKVNEAINERMKKGALVISYTGHGGEVGWGQERFLDIPDIVSWDNFDNLPAFLTATCEFSRYDDPSRVSAGELIFLNARGGGISLFTTARATFSGSNYTLSKNFYKILLKKENGKYLRMGDVMKETKRATGSNPNTLKFILLGDPALMLNFPEYKLNVTGIYKANTTQQIDTIKALSNITITGNVTDESGNLLSDFQGSVFPTIYDKPAKVTTLANDPGSYAYEFYVQKNILYKGEAHVENGEFEFTFIVPKDIAYKFGKGKISLYAKDDDIDATGYDREIIIGGYEDGGVVDNEGPEIALYIDTEEFINGGLTDENPVLLAFVSDENGINTTGNGIGHDISAILDGDENNLKILNDYYRSDINTYKSGAVEFPFFNLAEGSHSLELKVWDIYNNSSKASINFVVASSNSMALDQLFNYPNPVIDQTTFSFEHNQANEKLDITIDIYSIGGAFVTQLKESFIADGYRNTKIDWDVTDQGGSRLMKGIYIYNVYVKTSSGKEAYESAKMVVIK